MYVSFQFIFDSYPNPVSKFIPDPLKQKVPDPQHCF